MQRPPPTATISTLLDSIKHHLSSTTTNINAQHHLSQAFTSFSLLRLHSSLSSPFSLLLLDPIHSLLSSSISLFLFPQSAQLHSLSLSLGLSRHPSLLRLLASFYSSSGLLSHAHRLVSAEGPSDAHAWNVLISSYIRCGFSRNAIRAYQEMISTGVEADSYTYSAVLKACAQAKDLGLGVEVHDRYRSSGLEWSLFVHNAAVAMYAKCGEVALAREVFDGMGERDSVSWNTVINGYAAKGMWRDAFELFERMRGEGVDVNCVTWNTIANIKLRMGYFGEALGLILQIRWNGIWLDLAAMVIGLNACSRIGDVRLGKGIHGLAIRSYCDGSETVTNTLISMYSRCNRIKAAHLLFRKAKNRSLVTWNSMVTGFAMNDHAEEASMVFRELVSSGNEPNYVTVVTVLALCARVANLQHGRELHCFITKHGFKDFQLLWNSLVDMYSKSGKISTAQNVFNTMSDHNQISYTSLISGYGIQGEGMKSLQLFDEMISSGMKPDRIAMVAMLSACSHSKLVAEGQRLFDDMSNIYGLTPKMEHYSCMVDLYARAGLLEKAEEIINSMPFRPSEAVLAALLNACLVHKNTDIGERAANKLLEMNTQNAGHYVLIANMYAAVGSWDELAKVRTVMRDRGVRKPPGCAWVDIGTGFSPFLVGDRSSHVSPEIYLVTEGLIEQMRDVGNVDCELGFEEFGSIEEGEGF